MFTKVTILTESELEELKSASPSGILRSSNEILTRRLQECKEASSFNINRIGLKIDSDEYLRFSSKEAFNKIYSTFAVRFSTKDKYWIDQKVLEWFQITASIMQCHSSMTSPEDILQLRDKT